MRRVLYATVGAIGFLAACAQAGDDQRYLPLASALTKLAAAVDAYVIETPGAGQMASDDLLHAATAHDRSLLAPFGGHLVLARVAGRNSSVLVCSADGSHALLEDAGCTARSDIQLWRMSPPAPCAFSLGLSYVCTP